MAENMTNASVKKPQSAEILKNEKITDGVYRLVLHAPQIAASAKAGQFVNVYLPGGDMLLPRPFGIADVDGEMIEVVYAVVGKGTRRLSYMTTQGNSCAPAQVKDTIRVLGPNGNGFDLSEARRGALLIGGGLGIPPLRLAARQLAKPGDIPVTAVLGYAGAAFYLDDMRTAGAAVYAVSETDREVSADLGITGNVMDALAALVDTGRLDARGQTIFACGPPPMLSAIGTWARARGIGAQLSLEARMGCGYGACVGCTIEVTERGDDGAEHTVRKKVCTDGPVFRAEQIAEKGGAL
jgi:dihydroorotate dehydrogenase electron transfer subunit